MPAFKDTDYLFISTRVRALESNMLTRDRMERMLECRTNEDAVRVLVECGYPDPMDAITMQTIGAMLAAERKKVFSDLYSCAPDPTLIDVFRVKYDYSNVKVLLKAEAMKEQADHLLIDLGRVPVQSLSLAIASGEAQGIPAILQRAWREAREILSSTHNPQLADFVLDRYYFEDLSALAQEVESPFLAGYVRISIDAANLRSIVRTLRLGKSTEFLEGVLFSGGNVDRRTILNAVTSGASMEELFTSSYMAAAAHSGTAAMRGGALTQFERDCDNAIVGYLRTAKYVPFGDAPVVAYLAAKDLELTAIRIIMAGRFAGLPTDAIQERLRDSYV